MGAMKNRTFCVLVAGVCLCLGRLSADAQNILPLGDSVTSSFAPHSSYRYWLYHRLVNAGYNFDFVGTQHGVAGGTPTLTDYDWDHEGHPGWETQDALNNIDSIARATQPDIVLIDLGSNDAEQDIALENTTANLEAIIEHLRAFNPNIVVILAQPTPYAGQNNKQMSKLRSAIRKVAKVENQRDSRVVTVNLYGGFSVNKDTFDGMHPDESGEQKIAKHYYDALKKFLHK
jgi:lysophospholipase L1-like esterase